MKDPQCTRLQAAAQDGQLMYDSRVWDLVGVQLIHIHNIMSNNTVCYLSQVARLHFDHRQQITLIQFCLYNTQMPRYAF